MRIHNHIRIRIDLHIHIASIMENAMVEHLVTHTHAHTHTHTATGGGPGGIGTSLGSAAHNNHILHNNYHKRSAPSADADADADHRMRQIACRMPAAP